MNPKLISTIKAVLMALVTVFSFVGLGRYVPLVQMLLDNLNPIIELITALIGIVTMFLAWRPSTDQQTKGAMIFKQFKDSPKAQAAGDQRTNFFNY